MDKSINTEFYRGQGEEFLGSYEPDKAVVICKRLIAMDPKVKRYHYWWARIRWGQERYRWSELKFRETIILDPQDPDVLNKMGIVFSNQGKYDEAISVFQKALKIPQRKPDVLLGLAITLTKKGDYEEALEWYGKALEANPLNSSIHNSMGYLSFLQGKYTDALLKFDDAIKHGPLGEFSYFNKAMTLFCQSGMEEESRNAFEFGIQAITNGNVQILHTLKASVNNYNSEMNRVTKEMEHAEDLGPGVRVNLEKIQKGLEYILSLLVVEIEKLES